MDKDGKFFNREAEKVCLSSISEVAKKLLH